MMWGMIALLWATVICGSVAPVLALEAYDALLRENFRRFVWRTFFAGVLALACIAGAILLLIWTLELA